MGGEAAGGRGRGADTELKTKTPHVNAGKNSKFGAWKKLVFFEFV